MKAAGFETGFTFTVKILKRVFGVDTGQRRDKSNKTTKPTAASATGEIKLRLQALVIGGQHIKNRYILFELTLI
ncbi:hypothetical protein [Proteus mirabilis]|uniref:hypothetical protein n=1 Tax=Proteus mirabilis TaxID=584 RepID=UPI0034D4EEFF